MQYDIQISCFFVDLCLGDLSIADSGVLRSPTISVFLSLCLFIVVKSWLVYLAAPLLGM